MALSFNPSLAWILLATDGVKLSGVIVATMNSSGVAANLAGKKFTYTPNLANNAFKWTCTHDLAAGDEDIAPKGCTAAP